MARIKKHIPKAKLPFYSPCEVKCRLQNGVSTTPHAHTDPKKLVRSSHWSTHAELSHSILSLMVVRSPSSTHSSSIAPRRSSANCTGLADHNIVLITPVLSIAAQDRSHCADQAPIAPVSSIVAPRRSSKDRTGFDEFFFGFCFFCVRGLRNDIIYLFGSWENVSNK